MTPLPERSAEGERPSQLALAYARRHFKEQRFLDERVAEITGNTKQISDDSKAVGDFAIRIDKVLSGEGMTPLVSGSVMTKGIIRAVVDRHDLPAESTEEEKQQASEAEKINRHLVESIFQRVEDSWQFSTSDWGLSLIEGVDSIRRFAASKTVQPQEVLNEDELYFEYIRSTNEVADFVAMYGSPLFFLAETVEKTIKQQIRMQVEPVLTTRMRELDAINPDRLDDLIHLALLTSPGRKIQSETIQRMYRNSLLLLGESIKRYYGPKGFDKLPWQLVEAINVAYEGKMFDSTQS